MVMGGSLTAEGLYLSVNIPRANLDVPESEPQFVGSPTSGSVTMSTEPLWLDSNERVCVRVLRS